MNPFDYQNIGQQLFPQIQGGLTGQAIHPILMQLLSGLFANRGMEIPKPFAQPGPQYLGPPVQQTQGPQFLGPPAQQQPRPMAFPAQPPQLPQQAQATLGNFPTAFNQQRRTF